MAGLEEARDWGAQTILQAAYAYAIPSPETVAWMQAEGQAESVIAGLVRPDRRYGRP